VRQEVLNWKDVDALIDHLLPQFIGAFDALLLITRGGIIPGGMIAEALDITYILTAVVRFQADLQEKRLGWPVFLQFPGDALLRERRVLVVDDVWNGGRTITSVCGRVEGAGGQPETAVLHYKPGASLFKNIRPTYYAAITDAYIVYPWEVSRGLQGLSLPTISPA
jgi:hypoxanthine phosphoribosyltransferase